MTSDLGVAAPGLIIIPGEPRDKGMSPFYREPHVTAASVNLGFFIEFWNIQLTHMEADMLHENTSRKANI